MQEKFNALEDKSEETIQNEVRRDQRQGYEEEEELKVPAIAVVGERRENRAKLTSKEITERHFQTKYWYRPTNWGVPRNPRQIN
jgi:hypothetical protein